MQPWPHPSAAALRGWRRISETGRLLVEVRWCGLASSVRLISLLFLIAIDRQFVGRRPLQFSVSRPGSKSQSRRSQTCARFCRKSAVGLLKDTGNQLARGSCRDADS